MSTAENIFNRLYMVRHGESTCNTVNRIAGILDAPLTPLGRSQAKEAAQSAVMPVFDRIFISPLARASETAQIILQDHTVHPATLKVDPRLMERDFGSFTLENKAILQQRHGITEYERAMNHDSGIMSGGETSAEFGARVQSFFNDEILPALKRGENVLVVSHKYVVELICKIIIGKTDTEAYDLRLPNSQILKGDQVGRYLKNEKRSTNLAYDWIVVNHPLVFMAAILIGLTANSLGLSFDVSPYLLLGLLIVATTITMVRVEIESLSTYTAETPILKLAFFRYTVIPTILLGLAPYFAPVIDPDTLKVAIALFAAPSAAVAMTVSRCIGGLVVPTLAYKIASSLAALIPLSIVLIEGSNLGYLHLLSHIFLVSTGSVLIAYGIARHFRKTKPIAAAKFGDRNGHIAVLLLSAFAVIETSRIPLTTFWHDGLIAIGAALATRSFAWLLAGKKRVSAIDDYVGMSYPNVFAVMVLAALVNNDLLERAALWYLVPMFALASFDRWHARRIAIKPNDKRLRTLLSIPMPQH